VLASLCGPQARRFLAVEQGGGDCGDAGEALKRVCECMKSTQFAKLVGMLSGLKVLSSRGQVRRFRPGIDYETATGCGIEEGGYRLEASLTFADDDEGGGRRDGNDGSKAKKEGGEEEEEEEKEEEEEVTKADVWESGVVGGYQCYVEEGSGGSGGGYETMTGGGVEEDEDEESGPLVKNIVAGNCLCLALRESGVARFVKYVSAGAPSSRWEVAAEYEVEIEEGDGDGEDGEENAAEGDASSSSKA